MFNRSEAYIGVLIDDLVTKGTEEPYRMFTSRAEYRILLRQDNADERLTPFGHGIGLASVERLKNLEKKLASIESVRKVLSTTSISPDSAERMLLECGSKPLKQKIKAEKVLTRPHIKLSKMIESLPELSKLSGEKDDIVEQVEIRVKYEGYIEKEQAMADKMSKFERLTIPEDLDYSKLASLSSEAKQKLGEKRPKTLGEASKISGVSQSDVSVLLIYLGR